MQVWYNFTFVEKQESKQNKTNNYTHTWKSPWKGLYDRAKGGCPWVGRNVNALVFVFLFLYMFIPYNN